ncbi:hypothetical protein Bbelb_132510 [Branchiostoma belcheri]|nr:hypothetical protein Bbelb_132510 [Branchiostoma belcheri]
MAASDSMEPAVTTEDGTQAAEAPWNSRTQYKYNTGYSVSPEVSAGSPDGRRLEGDPTRGRAGTEGDAEYTIYSYRSFTQEQKHTISIPPPEQKDYGTLSPSVSSGLHESDLRRQRSHFPNSRSSPSVPYLNFMRPVLIYRAVIRSRERHLVRVGMLFEERSEKLKAAAEKVGNSTAFRIEAVAVSDGPDPVSTAEGFCAAQRDGRMQAVLTGRPGGPVGSEVLSTAIGIPVIQLGCSQQHQGDEKQIEHDRTQFGFYGMWELCNPDFTTVKCQPVDLTHREGPLLDESGGLFNVLEVGLKCHGVSACSQIRWIPYGGGTHLVTTRRTCFCVLSTCKNVGKRRASVRGEYRLRTESYGFGSTQTRRRTA